MLLTVSYERVWRVSSDGADIQHWLPKSSSIHTHSDVITTPGDVTQRQTAETGGDELIQVASAELRGATSRHHVTDWNIHRQSPQDTTDPVAGQ